MPDKEFNLLHEPWIMVMQKDGITKEVSILDAFRHASEYRALAGELPTQDVPILRLLLAILHAVFGTYDIEGNEDPLFIKNVEDALDRWAELYELGHFPMDVIQDYLSRYEERFFLFHPETPFYQVAGMGKSTEYNAAKLNGTLSESSNKVRLFSQRSGKNKGILTYPEAARWLLYVNAYDDTSAKPTSKGLNSPGAGWLGKLGIIFASGENLFRTLMLNLVLVHDNGHALWGREKPIWEDGVHKTERKEITNPDNLSELYTLQSRRLLLQRSGKEIVGYKLLGGDFFQKDNAFCEPMTMWHNNAKKEKDQPNYVPARHQPQRQIWRDLSAIVALQAGKRPEIVNWISFLKRENIIKKSISCFQTPAIAYGDKDFFVDDVFNDSISFDISLLTEAGEEKLTRILEELKTMDMLVSQLGYLAENLALAAGVDKKSNTPGAERDRQKMLAYYSLDTDFRKWLENIDDKETDIDKACEEWWKIEQNTVRRLGEKVIERAGVKAFIGGREGTKTSSESYNIFLYKTSSRQNLINKGGKK